MQTFKLNANVEITEEDFKKAEEFFNKTKKRELPKEGTNYVFIDSEGDRGFSKFFEGFSQDKFRFYNGNYRETEAEAIKYQAYLQALTRVRQYIWENRLEKEFVSGEKNWFIYKNLFESEIQCSSYEGTDDKPILGYLISSEACQQVITNCAKDLDEVFGYRG